MENSPILKIVVIYRKLAISANTHTTNTIAGNYVVHPTPPHDHNQPQTARHPKKTKQDETTATHVTQNHITPNHTQEHLREIETI